MRSSRRTSRISRTITTDAAVEITSRPTIEARIRTRALRKALIVITAVVIIVPAVVVIIVVVAPLAPGPGPGRAPGERERVWAAGG